jgi:hypothetical protein
LAVESSIIGDVSEKAAAEAQSANAPVIAGKRIAASRGGERRVSSGLELSDLMSALMRGLTR